MRQFVDSQVDVGKSAAENHRKTANNKPLCGKADPGRQPVSSKLSSQYRQRDGINLTRSRSPTKTGIAPVNGLRTSHRRRSPSNVTQQFS
jgi:hypothetical protein